MWPRPLVLVFILLVMLKPLVLTLHLMQRPLVLTLLLMQTSLVLRVFKFQIGRLTQGVLCATGSSWQAPWSCPAPYGVTLGNSSTTTASGSTWL